MDVKVRVIKKFNEELGSDLENLKGVEQMHTKLGNERLKVEECLSLASSEAPSKMKEAIEEVQQIINQVNEIKQRSETTASIIEKKLLQEIETSDLQTYIDKISYLEKSCSYLQFLKFIDNLSTEMEISLLSANDEACITSYTILKVTYQGLENSSCSHLKNYVCNTLKYWYDEIKKKFVSEYNEVLKALKWPFCGNNLNVSNPASHETIARFKIMTEHLFHLELPVIQKISNDPYIKISSSQHLVEKPASALSNSFEPVCLPVYLLIHPLKQRFLYHFTGVKKTNRRDKPEWFFTQVLTWIRDHSDWVEKMVQPLAYSAGLYKINVKFEFMRALVHLAVEKLNSELSIVQYDDSLFAHTVDESLGFERELRDSFLYPSSEPATVFVLTQAQIFMKWITMEKKYATEKMDAILSSETAWSRLAGFENDDMKVTECAEAFLTLLSTISDRYNHLPQPGHRLQFLDLQLELIDDWRIRLLQLLHEDYNDPVQSLMPSILNTLHYVASVLQDWGVSVSFLKLNFYKKQFENAETEMIEDNSNSLSEDSDKDVTVFDEAIGLLKLLEKKLIIEIDDSVFAEVKMKSRSYCNEKWFAMPPEKEISLSVTPSGCPMFLEIANRLHALHNALATLLFDQSWKHLASRLDRYMVDELILRNQFNSGGAAQIQFDVKRNLFPLFGLYTKRPETYFPLIGEACILLNMLLGSAILLLDALDSEEDETKREILADVNVFQITPPAASRILRNRMDISTR